LQLEQSHYRFAQDLETPMEPVHLTPDHQFEPVYRGPHGTPLYWRNEQSGELKAAVMAYAAYMAYPKTNPIPRPAQFELLIGYLTYVIDAPCWRGSSELDDLREQARRMGTPQEVDDWINRCLKIGIDPL
jgi:hypothetical protein